MTDTSLEVAGIEATTQAQGLAAQPAQSRVGDYFALLKPRVMSLVVFTGFAGLVAAPGALHPLLATVAEKASAELLRIQRAAIIRGQRLRADQLRGLRAAAELPPGPDDPARRAIEGGLSWLAKDLTTSATGAAALGDPQSCREGARNFPSA